MKPGAVTVGVGTGALGYLHAIAHAMQYFVNGMGVLDNATAISMAVVISPAIFFMFHKLGFSIDATSTPQAQDQQAKG